MMKTKFILLVALVILTMFNACEDESTPCDGQDCSGYGTCKWIQDGTPYCDCVSGYELHDDNPLACVRNGDSK